MRHKTCIFDKYPVLKKRSQEVTLYLDDGGDEDLIR